MKLAVMSVVFCAVGVAGFAWAADDEAQKVEVNVTALQKLGEENRAIEEVLPKTIGSLKGIDLGKGGVARIEAAYLITNGDKRAKKTRMTVWVAFYKNEPYGYKGNKTYPYEEGQEEKVCKIIARDFHRYCLR